MKTIIPLNYSVAPMLDCTDRHARYFLRLIAPHVRLYTEMVTAQAIMHGDRNYLLGFDPTEKYVALQLGGNQPVVLAECAKIGEDYGYDEINLNVGCPSDRVKSGQFGACLMYAPKLVAECVAAMQAAVKIPVTVKCRIGVDDHDSYEALTQFIATIAVAGCNTFIIHARKAWLHGLSPKENREIPPLRYDVVKQIKQDFPHLNIILNGGIKSIADIYANYQSVDGIMIGRAAYANPFLLAEIEAEFYHQQIPTRREVIEKFLPYLEKQLKSGIRLTAMIRHILGLFQSQPGAKAWRRYLSENAHLSGADIGIVKQALQLTKAT